MAFFFFLPKNWIGILRPAINEWRPKNIYLFGLMIEKTDLLCKYTFHGILIQFCMHGERILTNSWCLLSNAICIGVFPYLSVLWGSTFCAKTMDYLEYFSRTCWWTHKPKGLDFLVAKMFSQPCVESLGFNWE